MRIATPLFLLALTSAILAQEPTVQADRQASDSTTATQAAPAPRTARLSWFHGDVQIERSDSTMPAADTAVINMPLTEGSRLITGDNAEAEIEFEDGSVVRLTPGSALSIDTLATDGKTAETHLALLGGLAYFELRHAPAANYTISAGTLLTTPAENVVFRVSLDEPPALVSVLSGTLTVNAATGPENTTQAGFTAAVRAGESLHADPDDPSRYFLNPQLAENSWDSWNQARDATAATDASTRTTARDNYAGTQGYGWSDLDANGNWYTVGNPDGTTSELWQPAIAIDPGTESESADAFDPYGDGAFVYSGGAYLWASGYSWGWLPYRCGRWNYYPLLGWAWSPNRFCRIYGFAGGGGINIGRRPRNYHVIHFPPITPVHPILRVHTNTPRIPAPRKDNPVPVKIANATATPLLPTPNPVTTANGLVGGSLYRDYPVQSQTHKPILGSIAPPVTEPRPLTGWIAGPRSPDAPRSTRPETGESYLRPAVPVRAPAPAPAPAPRPAPATAPAAPSKPR